MLLNFKSTFSYEVQCRDTANEKWKTASLWGGFLIYKLKFSSTFEIFSISKTTLYMYLGC